MESDYWGIYEGLDATTMPRPAYNVSTATGASDLAGDMAAAFAASALALQSSDPAYAATLSAAAVTLYNAVRALTWFLSTCSVHVSPCSHQYVLLVSCYYDALEGSCLCSIADCCFVVYSAEFCSVLNHSSLCILHCEVLL